jgi:hypothetical protein
MRNAWTGKIRRPRTSPKTNQREVRSIAGYASDSGRSRTTSTARCFPEVGRVIEGEQITRPPAPTSMSVTIVRTSPPSRRTAPTARRTDPTTRAPCWNPPRACGAAGRDNADLAEVGAALGADEGGQPADGVPGRLASRLRHPPRRLSRPTCPCGCSSGRHGRIVPGN